MDHHLFNNNLLNIKSKLQFYALSLTSASDRADDLVQDTLLKALMYRDKFREDTNFNAWVYTIMKNTFINDYRRKVKERSIFDSGTEMKLVTPEDKAFPAPDTLYFTHEIINEINLLKDEFRIPFNFFLEGYMYKEIAERLELPLGTIKSRIFFTRQKLMCSLKEFSND